MGRLVEARRRDDVRGGLQESAPGNGGSASGDGFMDRVIKYIPSEVLAAYLGFDRMFGDAAGRLAAAPKSSVVASSLTVVTDGAGQVPTWHEMLNPHLPWVIFYLLLIITPFYIWQFAASSAAGSRGTAWKTHAFIASIAFVVWAYAIKGSYFMVNDYFDPKVATLLVFIFTVISGFVQPLEFTIAPPQALQKAALVAATAGLATPATVTAAVPAAKTSPSPTPARVAEAMPNDGRGRPL